MGWNNKRLEALVEKMLADNVSEQDIRLVVEEMTKKSPLRQDVTVGGDIPGDPQQDIVTTGVDIDPTDITQETDISKTTTISEAEKKGEEEEEEEKDPCAHMGGEPGEYCWDEDRGTCYRCDAMDEDIEKEDLEIKTQEDLDKAFDMDDIIPKEKQINPIKQDFIDQHDNPVATFDPETFTYSIDPESSQVLAIDQLPEDFDRTDVPKTMPGSFKPIAFLSDETISDKDKYSRMRMLCESARSTAGLDDDGIDKYIRELVGQDIENINEEEVRELVYAGKNLQWFCEGLNSLPEDNRRDFLTEGIGVSSKGEYWENDGDFSNFLNAAVDGNIKSRLVEVKRDRYRLPNGSYKYVKKGDETKLLLLEYPNAVLKNRNSILSVYEYYSHDLDGQEYIINTPKSKSDVEFDKEYLYSVLEYIKDNYPIEFYNEVGFRLAKKLTDLKLNDYKKNVTHAGEVSLISSSCDLCPGDGIDLGENGWDPPLINDTYEIWKFYNLVDDSIFEDYILFTNLTDCIFTDKLFNHLNEGGVTGNLNTKYSPEKYFWKPNGKPVSWKKLPVKIQRKYRQGGTAFSNTGYKEVDFNNMGGMELTDYKEFKPVVEAYFKYTDWNKEGLPGLNLGLKNDPKLAGKLADIYFQNSGGYDWAQNRSKKAIIKLMKDVNAPLWDSRMRCETSIRNSFKNAIIRPNPENPYPEKIYPNRYIDMDNLVARELLESKIIHHALKLSSLNYNNVLPDIVIFDEMADDSTYNYGVKFISTNCPKGKGYTRCGRFEDWIPRESLKNQFGKPWWGWLFDLDAITRTKTLNTIQYQKLHWKGMVENIQAQLPFVEILYVKGHMTKDKPYRWIGPTIGIKFPDGHVEWVYYNWVGYDRRRKGEIAYNASLRDQEGKKIPAPDTLQSDNVLTLIDTISQVVMNNEHRIDLLDYELLWDIDSERFKDYTNLYNKEIKPSKKQIRKIKKHIDDILDIEPKDLNKADGTAKTVKYNDYEYIYTYEGQGGALLYTEATKGRYGQAYELLKNRHPEIINAAEQLFRKQNNYKSYKKLDEYPNGTIIAGRYRNGFPYKLEQWYDENGNEIPHPTIFVDSSCLNPAVKKDCWKKARKKWNKLYPNAYSVDNGIVSIALELLEYQMTQNQASENIQDYVDQDRDFFHTQKDIRYVIYSERKMANHALYREITHRQGMLARTGEDLVEMTDFTIWFEMTVADPNKRFDYVITDGVVEPVLPFKRLDGSTCFIPARLYTKYLLESEKVKLLRDKMYADWLEIMSLSEMIIGDQYMYNEIMNRDHRYWSKLGARLTGNLQKIASGTIWQLGALIQSVGKFGDWLFDDGNLNPHFVEFTNKVMNEAVFINRVADAYTLIYGEDKKFLESPGEYMLNLMTDISPLIAAYCISPSLAYFYLLSQQSAEAAYKWDEATELPDGTKRNVGAILLEANLKAFSEFMIERWLTFPVLARWRKLFQGGKNKLKIKKSLWEDLKTYFLNWDFVLAATVREPASELLTQVAHACIELKPENAFDNWRKIYFDGFLMGVMLNSVPNAKHFIYGQFLSDAAKQSLLEKSAEALLLRKDIGDLTKERDKAMKEGNSELVDALNRQIDGKKKDLKAISAELHVEMQELEKNINGLSRRALDFYINFTGQIKLIQDRAQEIWDNKDLTNDEKQKMLEPLKEQFDYLDAARQLFLNPEVFGDVSHLFFGDPANSGAVLQYKKDAKKILISEGNKNPTDQQIEDKAKDLYKRDLILEDVDRINKAGAGDNLNVYETIDDAVDGINEMFDDLINKEEDVNKKEKLKKERDKIIQGIKDGNHGANIPPGITKGDAIEIQVIESMVRDDKLKIRVHEQWHTLSLKLFAGNPAALIEFSNAVQEFIENHPDTKIRGALIADMDVNVERGRDGKYKPDEVLAWFCEKVAEGKINLLETKKGKDGETISDPNTALLGSLLSSAIDKATNGADFHFESNREIIDFLIGIAGAINDGVLDTDQIQKIEDKVITLQIQQDVKDIEVKQKIKNSKVNDLYDDYTKGDEGAMWKIIEEYRGMAITITDRGYYNIDDFNTYRDDIINELLVNESRGVLGLIQSFNPDRSTEYTFKDKNGVDKNVRVIFKKNGEARINDEIVEELNNADNDTVREYIRKNYGEITKESKVPLAAHINRWLGPRSGEMVSIVVGKKPEEGMTIRPEPGEVDIWDTIFDGDMDGFDVVLDDVDTKAMYGVWRQVLDITKDSEIYNNVLNIVTETLNSVDPGSVVVDANGNIISVKDPKVFRKKLKDAYVGENLLRKKIKKLIGTKGSAKFEAFLRGNITVNGVEIPVIHMLVDQLAVKYRRNFRFMSTDGGRMNTDESVESQTSMEGSFVKDEGAGNHIWIKKYPETPQEIDAFVDEFIKGDNTHYERLVDALTNELILDATFDALPKNWENFTVHLQEIIKRDQDIKFSSVNQDGTSRYSVIPKDYNLKTLQNNVNILASIVDESNDINKIIDLNNNNLLIVVPNVDFLQVEIDIVVDAFNKGIVIDSDTKKFKDWLKEYAETNPNAAAVLEAYFNDPLLTKAGRTDAIMEELWDDFGKIAIRLANINNYLDKDRSLYNNHFGGFDVAAEKMDTENRRIIVDKNGKIIKFSKNNRSGKGITPFLIEGWIFLPERNVFKRLSDGKISKDPVRLENAKKIKGEYHDKWVKLQRDIKKQGLTDIVSVETLENVRLMNIGFPLMKKIQAVLDLPLSKQDKIDILNDPYYADQDGISIAQEAELATAANQEVGSAIIIEIFKMVANGDIKAKNAIHFMQAQTSLKGGIRGFSGIDFATILDGSQKELLQSLNEKVYGEHTKALNQLNKELTRIMFEYINFDANGNIESVNDGYDLEGNVKEVFSNFTQLLTNSDIARQLDGKHTIDGIEIDGKIYEGDRTKIIEQIDPNAVSLNGDPIRVHQANKDAQKIIDEETRIRNYENEQKRKRDDIIDNSSDVSFSHASGFDVDYTLLISENFIEATLGDQTKRISAAEWPEVGEQLAIEGWEFDFTDFNELNNPITLPHFDNLIEELTLYGPNGTYIITHRSAKAAKAIWMFVNGQIDAYNEANGTNVPHMLLENIIGLGDLQDPTGRIKNYGSSPQVKADWIEQNLIFNGINDIYFIDDHLPNVEAVRDMLNQYPEGVITNIRLEVAKPDEIQQKEEDMDKDIKFSANDQFLEILERVGGLNKNQKISAAVAKMHGQRRGRWQFIINPNADDFKGLLYSFLDKGKQGELDMEFFEDKLIKPFNRGMIEVNRRRQQISRDHKELVKNTPGIKDLLKQNLVRADGQPTYLTNDHAVRIYLWNKNGMSIPGLSQRDLDLAIRTVEGNPTLKRFANSLESIVNLEEGYLQPGEYWVIGNIATDLVEISNVAGRKQALAEFLKNKEEIFDEDTMNKIEYIYGPLFRNALDDMLYKMEYGKSRSYTHMSKLEKEWVDWVNGSIGAIMFFNTRSAVLQLLSIMNYIELTGPNNIINSAAAFANQKQFWGDFNTIWNSPYLRERRGGMRLDVNMNEMYDMLQKIQGSSMDKAKAAIAWLLQKGFTPTQIADSFAIAFGGSAYYRNYTKYYLKQTDPDTGELYTKEKAEKLAWDKFISTTELTQQSTRADKLSLEQSSTIGKFLLGFKNTPMQYTRLIVNAIRDLKNGRGSTGGNIATIVYYSTLQNLMFVGLQQALLLALYDDDPEWDKKSDRVVQSMIDNILYGFGLEGVIVVTIKNGILEFIEQDKKGWNADHAYTILAFANLSPTIGSKLRKVYSAIKGRQINRKVIAEMDWWDPQNPEWAVIANLIEAFTNLPTARVLRKMQNIIVAAELEASSPEEFEEIFFKKLMLLLGWNPWDLDIETKKDVIREEIKEEEIKIKEEKKKEEKEEEVLIDVEKEKEQNLKVNRCAGVTGDGDRCKNPVWEAGDYCTDHGGKKEGPTCGDNGGVSSKGKPCGNPAINDDGRCNVPQHQIGYEKSK